jgi:phospholipase C
LITTSAPIPYAANLPGEKAWYARPGTPTVNGLYSSLTSSGPTGPLLTRNPNLSNPLRLAPDQPMTCDQDHNYTAEQNAADHGAEDLYAQNTGKGVTLDKCLAGLTYKGVPEPVPAGASSNYAVMDYYDGNTVTALWNYAQHYAMSDNAYGTTYGPSTPGALNVTAAQTYGATCGPAFATINDSPCTAPPGYNSSDVAASNLTTSGAPTAAGSGTTYSDSDPTYDICSYLPSADGGDGNTPATTLGMGGTNIGDELTSAHDTWGWFEGGFDNGYVPGHGTPPTTAQICSQQNTNVGGGNRVHPAPRAVPVLRLHRQPDAPAAELRGGDRAHRPGEPPVRHRGLLGRRGRGRAARRFVSQGARLPGRPRRLLRSAGRADLADRHHQPPRVAADVEVHGGRHHLG